MEKDKASPSPLEALAADYEKSLGIDRAYVLGKAMMVIREIEPRTPLAKEARQYLLRNLRSTQVSAAFLLLVDLLMQKQDVVVRSPASER